MRASLTRASRFTISTRCGQRWIVSRRRSVACQLHTSYVGNVCCSKPTQVKCMSVTHQTRGGLLLGAAMDTKPTQVLAGQARMSLLVVTCRLMIVTCQLLIDAYRSGCLPGRLMLYMSLLVVTCRLMIVTCRLLIDAYRSRCLPGRLMLSRALCALSLSRRAFFSFLFFFASAAGDTSSVPSTKP